MNVKAYGAVGDGSTDDTTAIQNCIDAAVDGDIIYLPRGNYKITSPLTVTSNISIQGCGVVALRESLNSRVAFSQPTVSPYLAGSVIVPSTSGQDGIQITNSAACVHLSGFGVKFASGIASSDTGHGINAAPSTTYSSGSDHGLTDAHWRGLMVFGCDGGHYAYRFINPINCTFDHLRGYAGGGFYVECDSYGGNYGNLVFSHPYADVVNGSTAHGFYFKGRQGAGNSSGVLNLIHLIRPQAIISGNADASVQYAFLADGDIPDLTVDNPDFEPGATAKVSYGTGRRFITSAGIHGTLGGTKFTVETAENGALDRYSDLTVS